MSYLYKVLGSLSETLMTDTNYIDTDTDKY